MVGHGSVAREARAEIARAQADCVGSGLRLRDQYNGVSSPAPYCKPRHNILHAAAGPFAKPALPPVIEPEPVVEEKSKPKIPLVLRRLRRCGGSSRGRAGRASQRTISLWRRRCDVKAAGARQVAVERLSAIAAAAPKAPKKGEPATEALRQTSDEPDAQPEKFTLTERLATISDLNPNLEGIIEMLASVPVFSAAVGNGTSPLTVPTEDGRKLAYFFTEHADAEAFTRGEGECGRGSQCAGDRCLLS